MNTTIPAPTLVFSQEEWPDADFDLPEGAPLHADADEDDNEDWDVEMDLGNTGGAKAKAVVAGIAARSESLRKVPPPQMINIRPPLPIPDDEEEDEEDEGVSTIKVAQLVMPSTAAKPVVHVEEDMECDFALPSDLTQLSLVPLTLNHRASKNSLEWGDKDHTSSSQSSDAYSSLFTDASPSSNSASSASLPDTETEEDEDDKELEGLVIPSGLFESGQGGKKLNKILELKKKVQILNTRVKVASPDPEDDFEIGLVFDDDVDLSPSRLLLSAKEQQSQRAVMIRSKSMPPRSATALRPPSRMKSDRAKSPTNPPPSSTRQFQKLRLSPSPPLPSVQPPRTQSFQTLSGAPTSPSPSFLSPKPGSLRGQKSHSGLKPPTPPSSQRKLTRKASLSSLIESSSGSQASGSGTSCSSKPARYEAATAASRAKSHTNSTSRIRTTEFNCPPTRPSTPSSNPAALRLTMPTTLRLKSRPSIASVFPSPVTAIPQTSITRSTSPLPPRPPSSLSIKSRTSTSSRTLSPPQPPAPKVLRRPKRQRTYGDGTELDAFDDLPTDREKEGKYRIQPKGYGNRIPGGSFPSKSSESVIRGTLRKRGKRDVLSCVNDQPLTSATNTLKHAERIDLSTKPSSLDVQAKKKRRDPSSPSGHTRRKPTLIRNLGGAGTAKVVGEMKWDPQSLRWEGNDQVLRDFDVAVGTSMRPALITHLTGSSIGSPVGSFANGARVVGNMMFDPTRMCWISTLHPDEEEPDVFADLADDEDDDDSWEAKGGTIRANQPQPAPAPTPLDTSAVDTDFSSTNVELPSPARSHTRSMSESESDRGSRASMVYDVDESFLESCRLAEEKHRSEMKVWKNRVPADDVFAEPDRSYLYEIRALATRKY